MLMAILIAAAMLYFKENPLGQMTNPDPEHKSLKGEPIGKSPPPMGLDTKAKNFYSPLTTPISGSSYMKNPRIDPVPSIYNTVLNVDEKSRFDEQFFKKRQIYTNWDDMEENFALDNILRKDFPMTGAPLVNQLNKKEMVNPVKKYGMFINKVDTKFTEKPWM